MDSIKSQTINSVKWNGIDRFVGQGIQFLLTLFMARLLTPSDYGLIGLLAIFITISQTFIDSGFTTALLRTKAPTEKDFCTVFYFNVFIAIVVYTLLYFLAPLIAEFFNQIILNSVLRIYSLSLIINSLMAVQIAKLQIQLDFKTLALQKLTSVLLSGIIGIVLAFYGFGVWALVGQTLSSSIINLIFLCIACCWIPRDFFCFDSFHHLGSFGGRLLAAGLLDAIYRNLTRFAIGKFYTSADLGNYERGIQFAELPNKSINDVFSTVTFPILARIQDDERRLLQVYRRYIQMSSMIIFIVSGLLCALAKPIILFTLSDKWTEAIIFLHLFAITCMFDHLNSINLNLLKVKGRSDLFLKLEVVKKLISLFILACAIPLGVLAICLSKLLYTHIALFCNTYYTGKLFNYGYRLQFQDFLPYLLKAIFASIPAFLLTFAPLTNFVVIIIGTLVTLGVYYVLLRHDSNMLELQNVVVCYFKTMSK